MELGGNGDPLRRSGGTREYYSGVVINVAFYSGPSITRGVLCMVALLWDVVGSNRHEAASQEGAEWEPPPSHWAREESDDNNLE